jgi:hypothetical protein
MEKGLQLSTHNGHPTSAPCLELFGALNYLSVISKPDITFALGAFGFSSCPSEEHWYCLKRVLRYVQGTKTLSLVLGGQAGRSLAVFCDSDFAVMWNQDVQILATLHMLLEPWSTGPASVNAQ